MDIGRLKWRSRSAKWKRGGLRLTEERDEAIALMCAAADKEDAIEKLPVTPGPIVPAREQLGYLLARAEASHRRRRRHLQTALAIAPGRRGAIQGTARATELLGQK